MSAPRCSAISIYSHRSLERLLRGFNAAYNDRRQRVLDGKTPNQAKAERLKVEPKLARDAPNGHAGPCDVTKARLIADRAQEVSQPGSNAVVVALAAKLIRVAWALLRHGTDWAAMRPQAA